MTQNDMHTIEAVRLADGRSPLASLLDRLVSQMEAIEADVSAQRERIEELERESRRQSAIIGGLVEHAQIREEREARRNPRVHPAFAGTLVSFAPLVPSEPRRGQDD